VKAAADMTSSHGRFIWYELVTSDREAAAAFYADVVGWRTRDASKPGMPYTLFTTGDAAVSGLLGLSEEAKQMGVRPGWIGYVGVDDVDATTELIRQLGGAVHVRPQDILGMSRFSIVADPQMAPLALFRWLHRGPEQPPELSTRGHVGWHELLAADWEKAWPFYSEVFRWQKAETDHGAAGTYQVFCVGEQRIGGMFTKPAIAPGPLWLYYFNVGDINAAAMRVKAGNGQIVKGPLEMPNGNWIVQCTDPEGAMFALLGNNGIGYFERAPRPDANRAQ